MGQKSVTAGELVQGGDRPREIRFHLQPTFLHMSRRILSSSSVQGVLAIPGSSFSRKRFAAWSSVRPGRYFATLCQQWPCFRIAFKSNSSSCMVHLPFLRVGLRECIQRFRQALFDRPSISSAILIQLIFSPGAIVQATIRDVKTDKRIRTYSKS